MNPIISLITVLLGHFFMIFGAVKSEISMVLAGLGYLLLNGLDKK